MILVTGATGTNGVELIKALAAEGEMARALVRDPQKASSLLPEGTELFRGDLDDPASLAQAMEGIEKVFLLCPVSPKQPELEANVVDAAQSAGVRQVVKFSVIHASPDSSSTLLRWHAAAEEHIRASGLAYTFLRPNIFMQELMRQADSMRTRGEFYMPFGPDVRLSFVDVRDNAAVAAKVLCESGHEGKTYTLTGPAALTFPEIAQRFSAAAGKQIRHVQVPMDAWKQAFASSGAPDWLVNQVIELYETFVPANSLVTDTISRLLNRPARTIDAFAKENAGQLI